MITLRDTAKVVRSKNAGPFCLTLDIMFSNDKDYDQARNNITPAVIAELYNVNPTKLQIHHYPFVRAIKISMQRKYSAGSFEDRDVYGAQQHVPLLNLPLH